ncbi:MAG: hypothetical protein IJQ90_00210 [Alphaproteobacteria bacterium]|nr:hypothetical protein [Alphaproteobacteria bacterium]
MNKTKGVRMPSATKLVKHQEKTSQSKLAKQQKAREQANTENSVLVMDLDKALSTRDSKAALEILKQPSSLLGVMYPDKSHDIVCFYALHVIMLTIKDTDYQTVLQEMSDADIKNLKKILATAQERPCPNGDLTVKYLYELEREIAQGNGNIVAEAKKVSVGLYLSVFDHWNEAVTELTKLSGALDSFVRTVPVKQKWVTLKELSELLGFKTMSAYYSFKNRLAENHPEIESWFESVGKDKLFNMEHFDELRKLRHESLHHINNKFRPQPKGTWTILELADKMGIKAGDDTKKRNKIFGIKSALKKKFPYVVDYFTKDGQYFKAECFEDFKKLISQKSKKSQVAKPDNLWTMKELATKLGLKNEHALADIKLKLKRDNPDLADTIDSWFVYSNDAKGKSIKLFKAEHFDALQDLIEKGKKRKTKQRAPKSAKDITKLKPAVQKPMSDAEIKAALDAVLVKPDADATVVVPNPKPVEPKMTLTDVIALEKMVERWIEMLSAAYKKQDEAEQHYDDAFGKLSNVKSATERAELINQMQVANNEMVAAAEDVRKIQEKIDKAQALTRDRQTAIDALSAAEKVLAERNAAIAEFVKNANQK